MARKDDDVGSPGAPDGFGQTREQENAVNSTPEAGRPEPKSRSEWAKRGGDPEGKDPPARGGSSQGHSDREPI